MGLTVEEKFEAQNLLRTGSPLFRYCTTSSLSLLSSKLELFKFHKGDRILVQGVPSDYLYVVSSGEVIRYREESSVEHQVDRNQHGATINSMHSLHGDPSYTTAICMSDQCKAYGLSQENFQELLNDSSQLSTEIIRSLQKEVREQKNALRTPLLQLKQTKDINVPAVSMAAAMESYYRSALNARLNARLGGGTVSLFPNMHVQVPARVMYINGFKGLRAFLDKNVRPEEYENPKLVRYGVAIAPGILMNPISSILEASNAGHKNSEPLYRRWMRGFVPRAVREVVFGIGLNQLSDYFEERWAPYFTSPTLANAAGSLTAGAVSGYLSHVPHNLSALKLMEPHLSYGVHFRRFVETSVPEQLVPSGGSPGLRNTWRTMMALLFPRGLLIRQTQIVGSFIILNGTISYLARLDQERINRAFGESSGVAVAE
mmetsp:Transcript_6491/g.19703  ORF Transcript_6491/g.19703 Transcript_6491/m.19703 type:complete len:430 (+) Transcript_6491:135-1424(+)